MRIFTSLASSVFLAAASTAIAQSPCRTNLVPNGDFENQVVDVWSVSGNFSATYLLFAVDGVEPSRCIELTQSNATPIGTLRQPRPFQVTAGRTYEVAFEIETNSRPAVDLGVTVAAVRTSLASGQIQIGKTRVAVLFTPVQSGQATIDFDIVGEGGVGVRHRIDHVLVRGNDVLVTFDGPRTASSLEYWRVDAAPNANFALMLSANSLAPTQVGVAGCAGLVWLQAPIHTISVGALGVNGRSSGNLFIPFEVRGVGFQWQALTFSPTCNLGCASRIGF